MAPPGFEPGPFPSGKSTDPDESGVKSGAPAGDSAPATPTDPDLLRIIQAWPDLSPAVRAAMLAMVTATKPSNAGRGTGGQ